MLSRLIPIIETPAAVTVHSLACHAAVAMACRGFASLARCSARPINFVVHDDGSLEPEDRERLQAAVEGITFVDRHTADGMIESRLSRHPLCRAFRRSNPLALKLLDMPLLAAGGDVACCDTDVRAFSRFSGVFEFPDAETTGLFMRDTQNAYALRPWHLMASGIALPMCINTGLMLFRTSHHDLDFIEWFLGRQFNVYRRLPGWLEQTCWAALAHRGRCRLYDPTQVRVIRDADCLTDVALVIGHFTSDVRGLWDRAQPAPSEHDTTAVACVRTDAAERLTVMRLAAEQVGRAAGRTRTWIPRAPS